MEEEYKKTYEILKQQKDNIIAKLKENKDLSGNANLIKQLVEIDKSLRDYTELIKTKDAKK